MIEKKSLGGMILSGLLPPALGAGIGALAAKKGKGLEGAGYGSLLGLGSGLGAGVGTGLGFMAGGLGGIAMMPDKIDAKNNIDVATQAAAALSMPVGTALAGGILGVPIGAYGGYRLSRSMIGDKLMQDIYG